MNGSTNVQLVGFAGGLTTVIMWLLGYFAPALMENAPTGLEAGITGIIMVLAGLVFKPDAGIKQLPGTGT